MPSPSQLAAGLQTYTPKRTLLRETVNGVEITPQQSAALSATNPAYQAMDAYGEQAKARLTGAPAVDPSLDTFAEQAKARMMARQNALR